MVREYMASVSLVDYELGRIMDVLEELAPETTILFFSDHGASILQNRNGGKFTLTEADLRVPLVVASPAHAATFALGFK